MFDQLFEDYKNNHYNYLLIEQNDNKIFNP